MEQKLVFFIDVDNTLLNNDLVKEEIRRSLASGLGKEEAQHFWRHHDAFRERTALVDFPAITRGYCAERHANTCDLVVGNIFTAIAFERALYKDALNAVFHLRTMGRVFVFSEGDMVYQRQKIEKSGIAAAADGVLLYEHKLDHLSDIEKEHQDAVLVFIDDKDDTLLHIKQRLPHAVTVVVCQGHYAKENCPMSHRADLVAGSVGDLMHYSALDFLSGNAA